MIKKIWLILFWSVSFIWLNIIFPTFLLSILSALYVAIKTKQRNHFKTTETFSYHIKSTGEQSVAYSHYASFAAAIVVLVHSLFAYFHYDYGFYPVRDPGSVFIDVFCGMLWISGTSTLVIIVGRNFGEMLRNKGVKFIFNKRIVSYAKLTLIIIPINVGLWYLITLWKPELDNNRQTLPHLYLRFHHLWFFIYTILYYIITYLLIRFCNWRFSRKIVDIIKWPLDRFPDTVMLLISLLFLMKSSMGSIVGNPESTHSIEPLVFAYYFCIFIFGVLTSYSKNYIISYQKLFFYVIAAMGLMWFLYQLAIVKTDYQSIKMGLIVITTSLLIVCQQNLSLAMCCQFFSKINLGINLLKRGTALIFCFNLPLVLVLHSILKSFNFPILIKIVVINYLVWSFFIGLGYFFNFCSKQFVKKRKI
jgi:hypothetical protein